MTAAERFGLHPDALVLAKGMGGGYQPIGAAVLSKALTEALRKYEDVTPTFAWTPLACTAALANIEVIRKYRLVENAQTLGDYLQKRVSDLFHSCLPEQTAEVRGLGLMIGVELVQDAASRKPATRLVQKLLLALFKEGLMCCADWDSHTLILMPPLTISRQEIEKGLDIMEKVVRRWKS